MRNLLKKFREKLRGGLKSATVIVNAAFLAILPFYESAIVSLPELQPYLPENIYRKVGIAVVIINIVLRFRTHKPLEHK